MNFTCFILCLLFLSWADGFAQKSTIIRVNKNRLVNIPFPHYVLGEPHLSVNPENDNQLLIGAMMWSTDGTNEISCITVASLDGGKNWAWHKFPDKNSADPWTFLNSKGEAVFTMLGKDIMWTYYSQDGGLTWKDSIAHGTHHDHQTMVGLNSLVYLISAQTIRQKDGQLREAVYLARSNDGGKVFDFRTTIVQNNLSRNTMTPVVLSDGTLIIPYSEYAYRTSDGKQHKLSSNHAWTISSTDTGVTFSAPRFITDKGGGFPVLAVDKSELFKDRLYWVTSGDQGKAIYTFHSSNKGEGWSPATIVSNSDLKKTIPNIAVNKNGVVGVTWYEEENKAFCQNFYFAASTDGGISFSSPVKVSNHTSCADPKKNGNALKGGWSSGGHYTGLVAKSDGSFQAVWADARNGVYQLYMTEITVIIN